MSNEITIGSLIKKLKSRSASIRMRAVYALGMCYCEQGNDHVIKSLDDPDKIVRTYAVLVLGTKGNKSAVSALIRMLDDQDVMLRIAVVNSLGNIESTAAVDGLLHALKDIHSLKENEEEQVNSFFVGLCIYSALARISSVMKKLVELSDEDVSSNSKIRSAFAELIRRLEDPDAERREMAAEQLGCIADDQEVIEGLTRATLDPSSMVREKAIRSLMVLRSSSSLPALIRALDDIEPNVRRAAAEALTKVVGRQALIPLLNALKDEDEVVRRGAIAGLEQIPDNQSIEPLFQLLQTGISAHWAASALGKIPDAAPYLNNALRSSRSIVRQVAATALSEIRDVKAIPQLMEAITDDESSVRRESIRALGHIGAACAIEPIISCLGDENIYVRNFARRALARIRQRAILSTAVEQNGIPDLTAFLKIQQFVELQIETLGSKDASTRASSAELLGELKDKRALEPLIRLLNDPNNNVVRMAAGALGEIGDECSVQPLINILNAKDTWVRMKVVDALSALRSAKAIDGLVSLLRTDKCHDVRWRAASALGTIGDLRAIEPLKKALMDKNNSVRKHAADSLRELWELAGTPCPVPPNFKFRI